MKNMTNVMMRLKLHFRSLLRRYYMKYLEKTIFAIEKAEDNEKVVHFLGYGYYGEGIRPTAPMP